MVNPREGFCKACQCRILIDPDDHHDLPLGGALCYGTHDGNFNVDMCAMCYDNLYAELSEGYRGPNTTMSMMGFWFNPELGDWVSRSQG